MRTMVVMTKQLKLSEHRRYDKKLVHADFLNTNQQIFSIWMHIKLCFRSLCHGQTNWTKNLHSCLPSLLMPKGESLNWGRICYSQAHYWNGRTRGTSRFSRGERFLAYSPDLQRRRGIEARRKSIAPVGAWFSQIGRLHQVHHMWQYPWGMFVFNLCNAAHKTSHAQKFTETKGYPGESLAERWMGRDCFEGKISHVINWKWRYLFGTLQTAQLAQSMDAFILTPLSFSPLK